MTVCVAVAANDCIVFAADSASSVVQTDPSGRSAVVNVYSHGEKVFNLHKKTPVCAMTCGMGNIGSSSIGSLIKDLRSRLTEGGDDWRIDPKSYSIEHIVSLARKFLFEECYQKLVPPPASPHSLELWVGGYSLTPDGTSTPHMGHELWKITIIDGNCPEPIRVSKPGDYGVFWSGQPGPINRLIYGVDQGTYGVLLQAGVDHDQALILLDHLRQKLRYDLVSPVMPVQDAIDLADFLADTTKKAFRFLPGADIVGGSTDIAVVTKHEGFKWIRRKHYYPSALNPLETDHV